MVEITHFSMRQSVDVHRRPYHGRGHGWIAAHGRGLDTCPQQAFTQYHKIIHDVLELPDNEMVVCGMSLGYADMGKVENTLQTEREPVAGFVKFME